MTKEDNTEYTLYAAYGSNLNLNHMGVMTDYEIVDSGTIKDHRLVFVKGLATIEKEKGEEVKVGIYKIPNEQMIHVDRYESYPTLYNKKEMKIKKSNGDYLKAVVYIMNDIGRSNNYYKYQLPEPVYLRRVLRGFLDWGFSDDELSKAYDKTKKLKYS